MTGKTVDVCIICALADEARAVINEFSARCQVSFYQDFSAWNNYEYRYTTILNNHAELLMVLVIWMPFTGPVETSLFVKSLLQEFHPRFVAMTGICAGYKEKVALGDLVAAAYAFHYEEGKIESGRDGGDRLQPEWRTHSTTKSVVQYVHNFTIWEQPVAEMKQRIIGHELQEKERPKCLIAPVASGMAVQGNNPFPRLLEHNRKALFLDQEIAAFYQTLNEFSTLYFLAVKGVCDYGDQDKNDIYHDYAGRASAVYMLYFIQEYVTEKTMPSGTEHQTHNRKDLSDNHFFSKREASNIVTLTGLPRPERLIGRDREMRAVMTQLRMGETTVICALQGIGGIGKTALAAEALARLASDQTAFPGGVAWISCEGLRGDVGLANLWQRVADALQANRVGTLFNLDARRRALTEFLSTVPRVLLGLDNLEPDLDEKAVVETLAIPDHITLLITARHILPPHRIRSIRLPPLPYPEAGELFTQFLRQIAQFYDEERPTIKDKTVIPDLVAEVEGLPLAIELIASYAGIQRVNLSHLLQDLQAEGIHTAALDDPKRGLELIFDRSWTILTEAQYLLLANLSLLDGAGFVRETAQAISRVIRAQKQGIPKGASGTDVAQLVRLGLVETLEGERLRLHPLIRSFAVMKFPGLSGGIEVAQGALAQYYAAYVSEVTHTGLLSEEANIMLALEWSHNLGQNELQLALCNGMRQFWRDRGRRKESLFYLPWGIEAAKKVAEATKKREDRLVEAELSYTYGQILFQMSKLQGAIEYYNANLIIRRELSDQLGEGKVLSALSRSSILMGHIEAAKDYCNQALKIHRHIENYQEIGVDISSMGQITLYIGQLAEAERYKLEALAIRRQLGDQRGERIDLLALGEIALYRRRWEQAKHLLRQSLNLSRKLGDRRGEAVSLFRMGQIAVNLQKMRLAKDYLKKALSIHQEVEDIYGLGKVFAQLAILAEIQGDIEQAENFHRKSLASFREGELDLFVPGSLLTLGQFLMKQEGKRVEGCQMILEAKKRFEIMGLSTAEEELPSEQKAQEIAQKFGCENC